MTNEESLHWSEKLKSKWDLKNNAELVLVFLIYIATYVFCFFYLSKPILKSFGLETKVNPIVFLICSALATVPYLLVVLFFLNYNKKLKEKWLLKSNLQFFLVMILFSITGSSSMRLARPILDFLGLHSETVAWYIYWPLRLLIVFPAYQLLFLVFGFLLGQWDFAFRFVKKMMGGFGRLFGIKPEKEKK